MPTVNIPVKVVKQKFGNDLSFEQLEKICFDFGIELEQVPHEKSPEEDAYSFETASNRPDLLSAEGIFQALELYTGKIKVPHLRAVNLNQTLEKIVVKGNTKKIRPFVVAAIIRNVKFTQETYNSFIDFQDKLHHNICRKRTLVAIGTHDYDTIKGPFVYDARAPEEISFIPLNKTEKVDGHKLMEIYQTDLRLKTFLPIIRDSPVYPVIYDSNNVVLSLPPIINGDHSKITLDTKNIFIECTALDLNRSKTVLNVIVSLFSQYSSNPFTFEEVEIHYEEDNTVDKTPNSEPHIIHTNINYLNTVCGINIQLPEAIELLSKMGLSAKKETEETLQVEIPIYRPDIMHECDVAEDIAIAYGYNNIRNQLPQAITIGSQLLINQMSDLIRQELAQSGYQECLNFVLCSIDEITKDVLKNVETENFVKIANPKIVDTQTARNTLLPGLLKSLANNKTHKLPLQLFEMGDVVFKCENEVGAKNERRVAALYCDNETSGLELIHGLLDFIMVKLNSGFGAKDGGYSLEKSNHPSFFPERQANVCFGGKNVGIMGIVHPEVLNNFEIIYPTSYLELNLEPLIENFFKKLNQ